MPPRCWRYARTRARGSRESFPARNPDRSAAGRQLRSWLARPLETSANFDQVLLAKAEELSCQMHQPLLVLTYGTVAEGDRPHSLHQSESLVLAETAAQPDGVLGKARLAILLGLRGGLPLRCQTPAIPE